MHAPPAAQRWPITACRLIRPTCLREIDTFTGRLISVYYDKVSHAPLVGSIAAPLRWLAPTSDDVAAFVLRDDGVPGPSQQSETRRAD